MEGEPSKNIFLVKSGEFEVMKAYKSERRQSIMIGDFLHKNDKSES
jgi:CRP-like cAMP-binding protein